VDRPAEPSPWCGAEQGDASVDGGGGPEVVVAQPVAVAFEGEDVGVVDEAVDHGRGDDVVAEAQAAKLGLEVPWRLALFGRPGHAVTGDRSRGRSWMAPETMVGADFAHAIVDDHSRLAYVELHDDERAATVTAFVERALH
jgi:hypothetical protein